MSVIIDGTNGVSTPNTFAFKNRLIDAGFIINQRGYTSGTSLSAGSYGHDRWKGGAGGGTYTFTQGSAGVPIVITITAGTIQQVIEGCNVPEGGTYTLSWTGTATARINSGSYLSSPITVTSQTAGANMTIEFGTGTVSYPQLETGAQATSFDVRSYGTELMLCQRYLPAFNYVSNGIVCTAVQYGSSTLFANITFPVTARVSPTGATITGSVVAYPSGNTSSGGSFNASSQYVGQIAFTLSGSAGQAQDVRANSSTLQILFTGCEL
jgi:hypothetical protein